jgi:signal transduction histidine kinase/CheY-like chemotaxis protein/HPt (histidine-containing phosphotransfer) domain-containing protein
VFGAEAPDPFPRGAPVVAGYGAAEIGFDTRLGAIAQDRDGLLYFGGHGLVTFDGARWPGEVGAKSGYIRSLQFADDGKLWAVSSGGELGWFAPRAGRRPVYQSLRPQLPSASASYGEFWGLHIDRHGPVFVSENTVLRWTGDRFLTWRLADNRRLFPLPVGRELYVHANLEGLFRIDDTGPVRVIPQSVLGEHDPGWLERQPDGWLFASNYGLFHCDGRTVRPIATGIGDYLLAHRLTCGLRLPDGRIALGTLSGGIVILRHDGTEERRIRVSDGLPSDYIEELMVDRDGLLWIATHAGAARIGVGGRSELLDERAGLPRQAYTRLGVWNNRLLAIGDGGILSTGHGSGRFEADDALRGRWGTFHSEAGRLVLGGFRATRVWDGTRLAPFSASTEDTHVLMPRRNRPDQLYLSQRRRITVGDGTAEPDVIVHDLPINAASIAEDETGRLWLGTYGRDVLVARPAGNGPVLAEPVDPRHGLPPLADYVRTRALPDGTVFVFADAGGWVKRPGADRFVPVREQPARQIAAMAYHPDADGAFWLIHRDTGNRPHTVARVQLRGEQAVWEPHEVEALGAIGAPRAILATRDAAAGIVLWIGGTHRILRHTVGTAPSAPAPRAPLLHAYVYPETGDERRIIGEPLPYSARAVVFELATADYARRDQLRLETRIDGIDAGWVSPGTDARRELTAVRDGRYTVRARVVAATGAASPETVLAFTVLPPWWRTLPAALGLALVLAPAGYGFYRLRIRALRRRNAELEAKVRERTEALEQASAAKTQFVANMSHDIRNPLNGIVGLALALEDSKLDGRQREIVATLRECTTYLSSLVDDVLDFASIEAGKIELRPGPFVPGELLRSIAATLRADTADRGATLAIRADAALPARLLGDAGRIQQILVNYVSNALKYAGGTIELAATRPAGAPGEIEFSVRDRGPGIAPAEQATLFTKFTRLRRADQADIAGAGLGLAACRLLADHMGGSVGVESRPGEGARFFLRLPLEVAAGPVASAPSALPNTTVLLVEDTDYNAWAASAVLARLGLACDRARTGEEALRLFSDRRYNVVLLDRNLPDMDGTEVARRLRELEGDAAPAVLLAVTAYCTAEDRRLCLAAGMDDFVGKPLTPEKLRRALVDAGRRLLASASVRTEPTAPAPVAAPDDGTLDLSMLGYLAESDPEGLDHQIDRFLATLDEARTELAAAHAARDFGRLGLAAHRLVGQARMIGSDALAASAAALEAAARAADAAACGAGLTRVNAGMAAVTAAMRRCPQPVPSA